MIFQYKDQFQILEYCIYCTCLFMFVIQHKTLASSPSLILPLHRRPFPHLPQTNDSLRMIRLPLQSTTACALLPITNSSSSTLTAPLKRPRDPSPTSLKKRPRPAPYNLPGPLPCPSLLPPPTSPISTVSVTTPQPPPDLPDEVLVSIFRFVDHASRLANLRTVCQQWRRVIDDSPTVWRAVSFKNARFIADVVCTGTHLTLGPRPGRAAVSLAARSGNEWARFLKRVLFERKPLSAVTMPQPAATRLVSAKVALYERPFAPWAPDSLAHVAHPDGVWVAVHAARRSADHSDDENAADVHAPLLQNSHLNNMLPLPLPTGAMVGMVHVREAFQNPNSAAWVWRIDRAVSLRRPVRCAGFVGLWNVSGFLTDLLVNAMHSQ